MTLKELEKRIKNLVPGPLLILCRMPDGTEKEMNVLEMIATGSQFVHVTRGKNLDDLDKMIDYEFTQIRGYGLRKER